MKALRNYVQLLNASCIEIEKNCEHINDIISIDGSVAPHVSALPDAVKKLPAGEPDAEVGDDDIVCILYTSGTTGPPKGCSLPNDYYTLTAEEYIRCCDIHSNDRLITHLPLFHMNAQTTSIMSSIIVKASLILIERFSASQFWGQIQRYKPTLFNYIGAMLSILEELPRSSFERAHTMTRCWGGGAPKDQIKRIEKRFNLTVLEGYGSTEASIVIQNYYKSRPRKIGSVGLVSPGKEVKIVDEDDNELPPNTTGEIVVRGKGMMKGYFKEPEATAQAWKGGWFHTGDNGYMDDEGFFYFSDRKKDIIRRSGENISSAEVETVIKSHPKILDAAIIGVPDKITREEVKAYVILQPGETRKTLPPDEIISFCNERLAYFKVPRYVEYRDLDFPRTPTERIKKYELKAEKENLTEGCFDKNISERAGNSSP